MARNRILPNLLYGTLGLATASVLGYVAWRTLRTRRAHREDPMMSLRRSTRDVGRSIKDATQQVGKDVSRGVEDTLDSFQAAPVHDDVLTRI